MPPKRSEWKQCKKIRQKVKHIDFHLHLKQQIFRRKTVLNLYLHSSTIHPYPFSPPAPSAQWLMSGPNIMSCICQQGWTGSHRPPYKYSDACFQSLLGTRILLQILTRNALKPELQNFTAEGAQDWELEIIYVASSNMEGHRIFEPCLLYPCFPYPRRAQNSMSGIWTSCTICMYISLCIQRYVSQNPANWD